MKLTHVLIASLSVLSLLWSISIIVANTYAISHHDVCNDHCSAKELVLGIILFVHSMVGLIGGLRGSRRLLAIYAWVLFCWIFYLLFTAAFWYELSVWGGEHEYQLDQYPKIVRDFAIGGQKWIYQRKCMLTQRTCETLFENKYKGGDKNLRIENVPILDDCCQPPLSCGFIKKNETFWEIPKAWDPNSNKDQDCEKWSNDIQIMCYDCNSCKAGKIKTIRDDWKTDAELRIYSAIVNSVVFFLAFSGYRQVPTFKTTEKIPA